jgi:hypothetical protein
MRYLFTFFYRLFFTFLAAKLLIFLADWHSLKALVTITLVLMGNFYLFDYFDYRSRTCWRNCSSDPATMPEDSPEP